MIAIMYLHWQATHHTQLSSSTGGGDKTEQSRRSQSSRPVHTAIIVVAPCDSLSTHKTQCPVRARSVSPIPPTEPQSPSSAVHCPNGLIVVVY